MAQWEAFIDQLSPEERAEWDSMTPQERTEMRHELEAEQAEKDRIAEEERVDAAAASFKKAKQTPHKPFLEGLTDKVLGRGSSNIGNPLGEDAPGYPSDVFPTPVSKEVTKKYSGHPTARFLQKRKELQQQGPVAGAGTKATSAISNIRPDLAARKGLQDDRVIGKVDEVIDTGADTGGDTRGSFDLDGESLSIGEGGTTTAVDAIDRANAEANALESQTRGLRPEEEESSLLDDIGEGAKGIYDYINETLDPRKIGQLFNTRNLIAFLKSKGMPVDKQTVEDVQRLITESEPYVEEGEKILSAASPIGWKKSKYQMLPEVEEEIRDAGERVFHPKESDQRSWINRALNRGDRPDLPGEEEDIFGESREADYEGGQMPPPPSRETTDTRAKHTPHGRPESYDYDKEDYEGKVKTTPKRTEKFISRYKAAKTKKEKEEALPTNKDERAAVKEQAEPDKYYIDPDTGFALNMSQISRRIKRKDEMDMASLFPAADRAAYLYGKGLIDKPDYERMIKPSEKEEADALLTSVKTQEHLLKVAELKRKASRNPQEKNWIDLYKNAVTNKDYIMQGILGRKLGFKKSDLEKSREMSKAQELAKLKGKGKEFKSNFNVEYSTVISNKSDWQKRASAVVMGKENDEFDLNLGTGRPAKYTDRRGYFRSYGLYEQEDALAMGRSELDQILLKAPMARSFMGNPKYAGSDGNFDSSKFVADTTAYERYLMETLIFEGMSTLYQPGVYIKMMQYQAKHTKTGTFAKKLTNK